MAAVLLAGGEAGAQDVEHWSATLTRAEGVGGSDGRYGYVATTESDPGGTLDPSTFTYAGVSYTVNRLYVSTGGVTAVFETSPALPNNADLVLRLPTFRTVANGPCLVGGTEDFDLDADGAHASVTGRYEWNAHFSGSCLTVGDWTRDLSTTGTVKLIEPPTTDPVWSTTMTVGEVKTVEHGYHGPSGIGALDDDDFEYGSPAVTYTVQRLDVGTNTILFLVDKAGLPEADTLTLELAGHEFAFSARDSENSTGRVWVWLTPDELDEPATEFPVGATATVCLRTATQVCPAGRIVTPLSPDATLSGLSLGSGVTLIPTFASSTATYTASVANSVSEVTVTPTTNHASSTVAYLDASDAALADADTNAAGHQVALAVGETVIKVKVTAEDGTSTQTYTVTVTRAAAPTTCTLATGDIWCGVLTVGSNSAGSRNGYHSGQYGQLSDTKFDLSSTEYTVESIRWVTATGQRKDLILDLDALPASSVWGAWYLQVDASKYSTDNAEEVSGAQIGFTNAYGPPRTPPALNTAVTVRLTTSSTGALSSFPNLSALTVNDGNGNADLTLSPAFDTDTDEYTTSVASGVGTVTITATPADRGSVYYEVGSTRLVDADAMAAGFQVTLEPGVNTISVIVVSEDGGYLQQYYVEVTRPAALDTPTSFAAEADDAQVTLSWDAPASGSGVTGHEYRFKEGTGAYGDWMQIADSGVGGANEAGFTVTGLTNYRAHVFQLRAAGAGGYSTPATSEEVTPVLPDDFPEDTTTSGVVAVGGSATGALESVDDTADWFRVVLEAGKTYQIDMEGSETGRGDLVDPILLGIYDALGTLVLGFGSGVDDAGQGLNSRATFTPSAAGTYYVVASGVGSHTGGYTLFVREAMPADATLSALMVNDGSSDLTLTPAFASGTYAYTVSVANAVDEVTVTPTTNQAAATFAWLDADDNALDDAGTSTGHQVALAVGANVIKVKVTAGDGTSTQTYTVTVTRAAAMTCTLATGDIWCGVLTVGSNSGGSRNGYHSGQYGQLSDTKFDLSSTEYTVESIRWVTATGQRKDLILDLDALPAEDVLNAWYLQVDANKYQIANAQWEVTGDQIEFTNAYGPPRTPPALNTAVTVRLTTSSTGALSVEAALSALTVNDGNADLTLSPAFDRDTYDYTTSVASGVETVTFTATVIDDGSVIYRVGTTTTTLVDADAMAAGFQVTLEVGANAIDVDALSEDGGFREVYTVTVTRAGAVDTPTSFATEADDAQVTLSWDAPASGSGVTGHEYRYKSGTGSYPANFTEIPDSGVGGANEDGFTVTELTNDTVHVFQLRAAGGGGYSAPATSEEVTPAVADDFPADTTTSGVVAVGGSATGVIGLADDYDWFRVMLAAGKTYQIDMEGSETGRGDLDDPFLWAIHDGVGALVLDLTLDPGIDDGGQGFNSRATFTPSAAGTYHVEVTGRGSSTGGYTLFVREAMPADATLSALMVNDGSSDLTLTPAFASGTYAYTVSVANAVDEITVTPTTNQTAATFAWLDADDNALADADTTTGHQVALAVGANVFKVKVTGGDGTSTLTYTVTVTRAAAMTPATCTLNTGDVWCGVLTVAAGDGGSTSQGGTPNGYVGAGSSYKGSDTFGALSDTDFPVTHEGMTTTYTIQSIRWGTGSDSEERLFFELDARPPNAVADTWTLQIGSYNIKIHGFNDWSITHEAYTFFVGFGMTTPPASGSTVTVRLRKAAAAPTNFEAAVGDAQVVLSWDPPDSGSGVTRHEYRQKEGTGSYPANFTQIADSGVGGANEDGFTVTGLTNEVVHTFQLRAVDASGDGTAAEAGPVTPTPGICGRTQKVHENIVYYLENLYSVERTCAEVNVADLESFTVSLEMAGYEIASLKSGDFAGLSNLQTLELSSNTFTTLPANVFSGLTSLEILKLISGELSSLDARALSGLTTLQTLLLQSNDLDSLPGTVFTGLTALGTLELQENDLGTLPAGVFSGLAALHTLHLYDNDLTALPAGVFSGLSALEVLDLNDNDLTALPAGVFSGLSALEVLNLTDNDLDSLPGTVFSGLSNLLTLGLQNNDLSSLPDGLFFSLTAVTALKVDGNPVDPLPLTVTVEKFGTDQARAKVLAGAPFAVEFTATVVNGSLPTGVTKLGVAKGSVEGTPVTVERTTGMTGAVTVDIDLTTQPSLPTNHSGYEFEKAPSGLPVEILRATDSDATLSALVVNDGSADLTLTPAFSAETYAYAAAVARTVETVTVTPTKAISGAAVAYLDADDMAIADADTAAGQQVGLEPGENTIKVKVTATNMTDTLTYTLTVRRARPGICDRTEQIRTAILAEIAGVSDCADVTATHLAAITTFGGNIGFGTAIKGITALKPGDFAGLTALTLLNLSVNQLTALPAGIFSDLTAVTKIELEANRLASLPEGVFAGLAKLTAIGLYGNRLTGIPAGVFAGLPALTEIELTSNRLTGLPDGTFAGLAGLSYLKMDLNPDLAPFAVTLEKRTGVAEVRAVMPVGAPFAVPVPVALDNGTLAGDATAITVPAGATESDWVAVTRTAGTTGAVTVDVVLSTQPTLPSAHSGYAFGRGSGLPVTAIEATADDMPPDAPAGLMAMHTTTAAEVALSWTAATGVASYQYRFRVEDGDYSPWTAIADSASGEANAAGFTVTGLVNGFPHTFQVRARGSGTASGASNEAATTPGTGLGICDRTRQVRDAIVSKIAAADDCAAVTSAHLAGLERLNMSGDFQLRAGDLDGLTGLKQFSVNDSHQTGLSGSGLESLLAGIFSDLTNLRSLYLGDNRLSTLPDGVFGGLSKLKLLSLEDNQFAALPDGVFEGLTSLAVLSLRDNPGSPLAVPVNLEKVGTDQVKAVVPTGAPFELALTVSLTDADPATVTLTVSTGAVESAAATVARAADKTGAVVASLGTLPSLPTSKPSDAEFTHGGYALRAGEAKTILPESSAPQNFAAAPGDGRVVLSWDAPASDSGVTKHQYRQKAGAGTYEDWTDIANSAAGEANVGGFTVTGLTNETAYTFELRRFIGTSEGAAAEAGPVTPTPGICDRTQQVRDAIVARVSGAEKCNEVTVADLAGIGFLRIVDKGLTALEAGDFAGLTALETLSVTRNPSLTALPSGVFSGLTALVGLTLSENGLETLPANVFSGLTALEQVALLDNALRTLPAGVFSGLTRVQNLALQGNDLTSLPATVFDGLTGLGILQLHDNDLTLLPATVFSGLTGLRTLQLHDNDLTSLPETVFSGLRDVRLELQGNDLTSLPAGLFSGLGGMYLDLRGNDLTALPAGLFSGLTVVGALGLGDNPDAGDTLPLTVTLEKVGTNRVKAKVLAGAPFDVDVPVAVASGTLDGGATVLRVATGSVESAAVAVTRTEGTFAALTVDIDLSNQPEMPNSHSGYAFARAAGAEAVEIEPSQAPPLPAPTGLAATAGDGRATLVWDEAASDSGVTRHEYRYEADGDRTGWTAIPDSGPGGANASRFTVTGLANGRAHVFELRAVGDEGEGAAATVTVEPTGPPRIVSVEVVSGPGLDGDTYGAGEEIRIEVTFDQPVEVTGDPELALDVGGPRLAGLESGGGTDTLVFVYVVTADDRDADGIEVGGDAIRLDGASIGNGAGDGAELAHDAPGAQPGHRVDGARRAGVHTHAAFTHSHSHAHSRERYPEHTHEGHEHPDMANDHPAGMRPGQHVHHEQARPHPAVFLGPDLRGHDGVEHTHLCYDLKPSCNKGDAFTSGTPGLPIEVTHDHENSEPGHGFDWAGDNFEAAPPAPTGVTATPGAGQVRLAWEAPALEWDPKALAWVVPVPGLPAHVTHHEYRWTTDGADVGWTAIPDSALFGGNQAGFTVTGLADGKTYTFELRAANAGGGGPPVQAENVTTATVPEIEGVEVASTPDRNDTYGAGDGIRIEVTFDQAVEVEGDPEFGLSVGGERVAMYRWGSGTEVLVFVYTVRPEDRDRDGIWIGAHDHAENPTFRLDGDDRIRNAAGQDADLSHDAPGRLRNHKVNGGGESPGEDEHSHQEFTHSHGHSRGAFAQVFARHGHAYHVHDDTDDGHSSAMRPGQHVHHVQENLSGDFGPDLRGHGGVEHTHWCGDIEPDCNPDRETVQVADELGLPIRVTHAHTDSEPGHRFGWRGYFGEAGSDPLLSVMGAEATEGDDGALDFTVRLDREPRSEVTVRYATEDGDATAGSDYTATRGTLRFGPGETAKTVRVPILDDTVQDDGETLTLALSNASGAGIWSQAATATGTIHNREEREGPAPLTARFEDLPPGHDGESVFRFRVAFSADIGISYRSLREDAFEVAGGRVTRGARVDDRRDLFEMTVEPDGGGEVTVTLPAGRECSVSGAICTKEENRRQLTNTPTATVAGPAVEETGPAPLTASFEGMPGEHDGESAFTFRVAFSADIGISYRSLREDAFEVAGGRVTRGKRVDDRRDLFEMTVEPDGGGAVTVTLPAGRECSVSGAICTRGENRRQLTNTPTATVAGPEVETAGPALTASFVDMPSEHDGKAFTLGVAFSEEIRMSGRRLRSDAVAVSGGRATKAAPVNGRKDLWTLTVRPDSLAEVTVTLAGGAACDTPAAVCTADGKALSSTVSTTVRGPVALSVADARAREGKDPTLDFAVSLSRASSGRVTVDYATVDGSAKAGADYEATSGTLSFAPGETAKTVAVPVLDDAHDEGTEVLVLRLENARGARLGDRLAVGRIENTDHMPAAWLARFGRTVTDQVLDAVEARLAAPRAAGTRVRLAGQALPFWDAAADAKTAANPGSGSGAGDTASERALAARDREAMTAIRDWMAQAGAGDAWRGDGDGPDGRVRSRALTGRDFVTGTSFELTDGSAEAGGHAALWGRGAISRFDGREGALTLDGEVATGLMGADWASAPGPGSGAGRWTAGLAVGHARGTGSYTEGGNCTDGDGDDSDGDGNDPGPSGCAGEVEASLTGLWPYAGLKLTDRLSISAAVGYGAGELTLTPKSETDGPFTADLTMAMGAAGLRGEVLTPPPEGGLALAVKGDTRFTRTASEATKDADGGDLEAATADVWLLRLGIEGSRRFALGADGAGATLTPSFEVGARLDGGDAETGLGVDLGGGLAFAAPKKGLSFDLKARGLVAHEAPGFREWGASAALTWNPRPTTDRGLALRLRQGWGGSPTGGMDALLGRETLAGLAADPGSGAGAGDNGGTASAGRLEAELGYGIALFGGGFTGTPNLGIGLSDTSRDYRLGWRLTSARPGDPGFEIGLDATRREALGADAEHGLMLRGTIRW